MIKIAQLRILLERIKILIDKEDKEIPLSKSHCFPVFVSA
jgi:hypothetical protein